jgi:hypothetical protein
MKIVDRKKRYIYIYTHRDIRMLLLSTQIMGYLDQVPIGAL